MTSCFGASELTPPWTAASLTLLAVTKVARPQAAAKCRHCEAAGRGNPWLHALTQVPSFQHGLPRRFAPRSDWHRGPALFVYQLSTMPPRKGRVCPAASALQSQARVSAGSITASSSRLAAMFMALPLSTCWASSWANKASRYAPSGWASNSFLKPKRTAPSRPMAPNSPLGQAMVHSGA